MRTNLLHITFMAMSLSSSLVLSSSLLVLTSARITITHELPIRASCSQATLFERKLPQVIFVESKLLVSYQ